MMKQHDLWKKTLRGLACLCALALVIMLVRFKKPTQNTAAPPPSSHTASNVLPTPTPIPTPEPTPVPTPTPEELETLMAEQGLLIRNTEYIYIPDSYGAFHASLENTTEQDILDAKVVLLGWDVNGLPIKLWPHGEAAFGVEIDYDGINLIPSGISSDSSGYKLSGCGRISTYRAAVSQYTTAAGEIVENPRFEEWRSLYEGKKLESVTASFPSSQALLDSGLYNGTLSSLKNLAFSSDDTMTVAGTISATENGLKLTYTAEGSLFDTLADGYGNQITAVLMIGGIDILQETKSILQKNCGISEPAVTVELAKNDGTVLYSEDITSEIMDSLAQSLG